MVRFLIIDFLQNICNYAYYIIRSLCENYMSLHCSMLSTRCIIDFLQNICNYAYYIIRSLCENYMSLHCSMLSTRCIKATVPSIR